MASPAAMTSPEETARIKGRDAVMRWCRIMSTWGRLTMTRNLRRGPGGPGTGSPAAIRKTKGASGPEKANHEDPPSPPQPAQTVCERRLRPPGRRQAGMACREHPLFAHRRGRRSDPRRDSRARGAHGCAGQGAADNRQNREVPVSVSGMTFTPLRQVCSLMADQVPRAALASSVYRCPGLPV